MRIGQVPCAAVRPKLPLQCSWIDMQPKTKQRMEDVTPTLSSSLLSLLRVCLALLKAADNKAGCKATLGTELNLGAKGRRIFEFWVTQTSSIHLQDLNQTNREQNVWL